MPPIDHDGTCADDYGQGETECALGAFLPATGFYDSPHRKAQHADSARLACVAALTLGAALLWAWVKS